MVDRHATVTHHPYAPGMTFRYKLVTKLPGRATIVGVPVTTEQMEAAKNGKTAKAGTVKGAKRKGSAAKASAANGAATKGDGPQPDWDYLVSRGFDAKPGNAQSMPTADGPVVIALGVGPSRSVDARILRRAAANMARSAKHHKHLATTLLDAAPKRLGRDRAAQAIVEGIGLGSYRFRTYKSADEDHELSQISIVGGGKTAAEGLAVGQAVVHGVTVARDLVNEPGGTLTPAELARRTRTVCRSAGIQVTIHDEKAIADKGLGGLLGVNRGSDHPARFVELTYKPEVRNAPTVALVGKGITFDSGACRSSPGRG